MRISAIKRSEYGSYELSLSAGSKSLSVVLVSPLDFSMHLLELPSVNDAHLEGSARIKLRSLYPGSLDGLAIDVPARNKDSTKAGTGLAKIVAFAADNSVVNDYHARGATLIHPFTILARYGRAVPSGEQIGILVTDAWREYIRLSDGIPILEAATPSGTENPLDEAMGFFELDDISSVDVFIIKFDDVGTSERDTENAIQVESFHDSANKSQFRSCRTLDLASLPEIVREIDPSKDRIFYPSRKKTRSPGRNAAIALIALNALAFFALTEIRIAAGSRELAGLKARYSIMQQKIEKIQKAREEIKSIEKIGKKSVNIIPGNPYPILSALGDGLVGIEIRSLTIDGSAFQLTATAPDAVRVLSCIAAKPSFRKVSIQQSAKSEDGTELFTITGEINYVAE